MKSKDRLKEEIGLDKLNITILTAIEISLVAFIWQNLGEFSLLELCFFGFIAVIFLITIALNYHNAHKRIKELDHYD